MEQWQIRRNHRSSVRQYYLPLLVLWLITVFFKASTAADYEQQIKPLLKQRCYACHGALKQEAGLRLDTVSAMRAGGDSGAAVDTVKPESSNLIQRLRHGDPSQRMPPEGEPLGDEQIGWIESWINTGAEPPSNDQPQTDPRDHWAFQNPQQAPLPALNIQLTNPIDRFLAAKQLQLGVQPLEVADKQTLARRMYIDLLGIPPTPLEVRQFVADESPDANEKLVDQLLARPEYGERWGRHWMDVWRYSDWYGRRAVPDVMNSYPQIWRWRDWIVRSLNEDKGYDRMIMEMLAADELCPLEDDNVVATGFLVRNWYKWNYETWMKDNVEHTGKAFLGLTLNCAHCHNHKYDPISHEDYFRFRAFFEPLELRHDRVAHEPDPGPFKKYVYADSYGPIKSGAIRVFDEKLDAKTYMYTAGDARNRLADKPPVSPGPPQSLGRSEFVVEPISLPIEAAYPGLKEFVRQDELRQNVAELEQAKTTIATTSSALDQSIAKLDELTAQASGPATAANYPSQQSIKEAYQSVNLARLEAKIAAAGLSIAHAKSDSLHKRMAADDARYRGVGNAELQAKLANRSERQVVYASADQATLIAEKAMLIAEQKLASTDKADDAKLTAVKQEVAKAEQALSVSRKNLDDARAALNLDDATYTALSPAYPTTSSGRRLALAKWIVHRENPLTARVAINHIWLRHFDQALVETTDNLGMQGKPPEHPEILDWLAVELMNHGWSMKHIHRMILNSQTYQRRSTASADHPAHAIDRENRNYWRAATRRMEAEVVRDSVIACSGAMDRTMGGPEIDPAAWHSTPRRSLYFTIHGESKMQFLEIFDGPNVCDCYRRSSTVLPQQALAMTNSELLVNYGRILAKRILEEALSSEGSVDSIDQRFVCGAFLRIVNRPPSAAEMEYSLQFIQQQRQLFGTTTDDQLKSGDDKEITPADPDVAQRARENLTISLFSHNDFVTIR